MSALQPRTWAEGDRVAQVDRRSPSWQWQLGTVTTVNRIRAAVRWDDTVTVSIFTLPAAQGLVHEHEVPVDERHWLDPQERDRLVRQQAAARLLNLVDELCFWELGEVLGIAEELEHPVASHAPALVRAARALLAPTPVDEPTPINPIPNIERTAI